MVSPRSWRGIPVQLCQPIAAWTSLLAAPHPLQLTIWRRFVGPSRHLVTSRYEVYAREMVGVASAVARDRADMIPRFGRSERAAHWLLTVAFASMLFSGAFMGGIGPLSHRVLLIVHVGSSVGLLAGLLALLLGHRSREPLAQAAHDLRGLNRSDRRWLRAAPRIYLKGGELPPAGRFNAGQKINARLVLLALALLYITGVGELQRYASFLDPLSFVSGFHGLLAGATAALIVPHIYLALVHPATRHALRGMTLGSVRREWAEEHHSEWVASIDAAPAPVRGESHDQERRQRS